MLKRAHTRSLRGVPVGSRIIPLSKKRSLRIRLDVERHVRKLRLQLQLPGRRRSLWKKKLKRRRRI
jgi:hypothetical protein